LEVLEALTGARVALVALLVLLDLVASPDGAGAEA